MIRNIKKNLKIYFLFGLLGLNVLVFHSVGNVNGKDLSVVFLDVGQGDSIYIQAPNGRQLLVDGGPNMSVLRELGKVMPFYDRSIDVVLATHMDQDHIGGLVEVFKRFDVDLFVRTNATSSSAVYLELEKLIQQKNIREEIIIMPEKLSLGSGTNLDIIFPVQDTTGWEMNDSSIVGRLSYGENSFLLTGDAPQVIEKYLIGHYGALLKSDVLKIGHHGAKNSSAEVFIGTVAPIYSIISAGINNRYGHPTQIVLDTLSQFGSQILKTMDQGTIIFKSDGKNLRLVK